MRHWGRTSEGLTTLRRHITGGQLLLYSKYRSKQAGIQVRGVNNEEYVTEARVKGDIRSPFLQVSQANCKFVRA